MAYSPKNRQHISAVRVPKHHPVRSAGRYTLLPWHYGTLCVMACMVLVCGAGYVSIVNDAAIKGNDIRSLERQINQLQEQEKLLSVKEAQLRTVTTTTADGKDFIAVIPEDVQTVTANGDLGLSQEHHDLVALRD